MDDEDRLQLDAIEGQPKMKREDFETIASITYLDQQGRGCQRMERRIEQPAS